MAQPDTLSMAQYKTFNLTKTTQCLNSISLNSDHIKGQSDEYKMRKRNSPWILLYSEFIEMFRLVYLNFNPEQLQTLVV